MERADSLAAGVLVAEKYLVEREIGRGGMGVVLAAKHVALGVRVALKVLTVSTGATGAVGRFLREARATASLRSEFVARISDFGTLPDGRPFMVLEYLEGEDLGATLERGMKLEEIADALCQACAGLAEAHAAGIVHRDLKPSNLFRTRRPDGSVCVKVLDFGISKLIGAVPDAQLVSTDTSAVLGTPLYMSPEQVRSTRDADARSDVWSLGVVLAEASSREPPFTGQTLGEVFARILEAEPTLARGARAVPPALCPVVLRCLEKRPEARFQSVAELAIALAPFASLEGKEAARRARDTVAVVPAKRRAEDDAPASPANAAAMAETIDASTVDATIDTRGARTAPVGVTKERDGAPPRSLRAPFLLAAATLGLGVIALVALRVRSEPATQPADVVFESTFATSAPSAPSTLSATFAPPVTVMPSNSSSAEPQTDARPPPSGVGAPGPARPSSRGDVPPSPTVVRSTSAPPTPPPKSTRPTLD